MSLSHVRRLAAVTLLALGAACSSSDDTIALSSATQDLTLDPTGQTTVLVYAAPVSTGLDTQNFSASGGQTPLDVTVDDATVTIGWDARVTPSHTVRAVAAGGLSTSPRAVVTSDDTGPSFTVSGVQNPGVGGDEITVTFSGPRVVTAFAEDASNWTLTNNGQDMDLTGSTFSLDVATQVLTVDLGPNADVFGSFDFTAGAGVVSVADVALATSSVNGAGVGDAVAPTLTSVVQNLVSAAGGNEFGTVVDLTFSEPMSPVFSAITTNFGATFPVFATSAAPVVGSPEIVRVTYSGPIVPGVNTLRLNNLVDAHGNPLGEQLNVPVVSDGSLAGNAFSVVPTVEPVANSGGDTITAVMTDALDPSVAADAGRWYLESPVATPIDISAATFVYTESTKTLRVTLATDVVNGDSFEFGALAGNEPRSIDGTDFVATATGTVSGETTPPTLSSVVQNRGIDDDGLTFDVTFSEDVEETTAETTGNYTFSSGANVTSATLQAGRDVVRIVLDAIAVPGEHTVDVANVIDLAGTAMAPVLASAITSSDMAAPSISAAVANAISGVDNDTLVVTFDDAMFEAEVVDATNWTVESPVGTALDATNASIVYTAGTDSATLTFDGGDDLYFQGGDDFRVALANMRDVSGNTVTSNAFEGAVDAESDLPELESVWYENAPANNVVHVRFSEAATEFDDLASGLTRYIVRDSGGSDLGGGTPTVMVDADRRGAVLTYGLGMTAGNTLDVRGITDLAGNQMVPVLSFPMVAASATEPDPFGAAPEHVSVSGDANDSLIVTFAEPVSTFGLFDPANWSLTNGTDVADFSRATFEFDGSTLLTITFGENGAYSFDQSVHTLTVDGLVSAQGVTMTGPVNSATVAAIGNDALAAGAGNTRLDAAQSLTDLLVEFDEAIDPTDAEVLGNYLLNGATAPDSATKLGPRTVRLSFGGGVDVLDTVDVTVEDLAGNAALATHAIGAADTTGPVLQSAVGVAVAGVGNDRFELSYSGPIGLASGLDLSNYTITEAGLPVSLVGATAHWDSVNARVVITLSDAVELSIGSAINVQAADIQNHAGIVMSPNADVNGSVQGDSDDPNFETAFVNFRVGVGATVVDVHFDEAVDPAFATNAGNYTASGGQTVTSADALAAHRVRLTLAAPLVDGDTIAVTGLTDLAGNASGMVSVAPVF
ncbi:MAG: hypothetical protein WD226_08785 [Planctomycetota bacterium]